jgi:transposase
VTKWLGILDGVLYTWVSKFKKADKPISINFKPLQAEMAKLKAELRRTTEERDILKSPLCTLLSSPSEVRIHLSP